MFQIRTSMSGADTIVNDLVVGRIDENGWFPSIMNSHQPFFQFTPEQLRKIATKSDELAAYKRLTRSQ